jgi:hypothetical protein
MQSGKRGEKEKGQKEYATTGKMQVRRERWGGGGGVRETPFEALIQASARTLRAGLRLSFQPQCNEICIQFSITKSQPTLDVSSNSLFAGSKDGGVG